MDRTTSNSAGTPVLDYARLEKSLKDIVSTNGPDPTVPFVIEALARSEHLSRNEAISVMWRLVDKYELLYGAGTVSLNAVS